MRVKKILILGLQESKTKVLAVNCVCVCVTGWGGEISEHYETGLQKIASYLEALLKKRGE